MIYCFITSELEPVYYHRILPIYRKITGKPEVIDLISLNDEQMIEIYGSSDVNKLTHIVGDKQFQKFNNKIEFLKKLNISIYRPDVEILINELRKDGPYRVK